MTRTASQAIADKLAHAATHAAQTADRTAPHYVWLEEHSEIKLYRVYPMQGMRVRQSDVTLFARAAQ
jgi:hypothetical protein